MGGEMRITRLDKTGAWNWRGWRPNILSFRPYHFAPLDHHNFDHIALRNQRHQFCVLVPRACASRKAAPPSWAAQLPRCRHPPASFHWTAALAPRRRALKSERTAASAALVSRCGSVAAAGQWRSVSPLARYRDRGNGRCSGSRW
jgi:hypothetical protein